MQRLKRLVELMLRERTVFLVDLFGAPGVKKSSSFYVILKKSSLVNLIADIAKKANRRRNSFSFLNYRKIPTK